jgi:hypothetical protein
MSTPPPGDTDRLIAAHRDEARRTRTLLVAIFVGAPVVGLALWAIVAVIAAGVASQPSAVSYDAATEFSAPATTTTVEPTTVPAAMAAFEVADTTMCSAIDDWYATSSGLDNPRDGAIFGGVDYVSADPLAAYLEATGRPYSDVAAVQTVCAGHNGRGGLPADETVLYALGHPSQP